MVKLITALACATLVASVTARAEETTAVFHATGKWTADYGTDYCRLSRPFSDGTNKVVLGLERIGPSDSLQLLLVGNGLNVFRGAPGVGYTFLPTQAEHETGVARATMADGSAYLSLGPITVLPSSRDGGRSTTQAAYDRATELAAAKPISAIGLRKGMTGPVRLETGALDAPVAALQACVDDLAKSWGVDPLIPQAEPKRAADWLPRNMLTLSDFGKLFGNANQVLMLVNIDGNPMSCRILQPTLDKALLDRVCGILMQKAQFTPAHNAVGTAVASYWLNAIPFVITVTTTTRP